MNRTTFFLLACRVALCLVAPLFAQDQSTRPPITGIAHVRVYATDLRSPLIFTAECSGCRHAAEAARA